MALCRSPMRGSRLWFIVPLVALLELGGQFWISVRAANPAEWSTITGPVRQLASPGSALVVAPHWAEPLARHVLGDELWPVDDLARMDERGVARVVEVSLYGATHPATAEWPLERQLSQGPFRFTARKNPRYEPALFSLIDAVTRAEARAFRRIDGSHFACVLQQNLAPRTGGLHGHVAFPSTRYVCGKRPDEFVGVTLIDDEQFAPRRCVWIHAPPEGEQWLVFEDVALGRKLEGYAGSSYFLTRDRNSGFMTIELRVDGSFAGKTQYSDPEGWSHFSFATTKFSGRRGRLEFKVSASGTAGGRSLCLAAETR